MPIVKNLAHNDDVRSHFNEQVDETTSDENEEATMSRHSFYDGVSPAPSDERLFEL
jgi:hypothetical protein